MWLCAGKTTAAATTGPARGPRPASSRPAMHRYPASCAALSMDKKAPCEITRRAMGSLLLDLPQASLLDAGCPTSQLPQIKQLGAPHLAAPHHLNGIQFGGVQGKNALHPYPIRHFTDGEGASPSTPTNGNNHAFKSLHTLAVALHEPDLHADRIASAKLWQVLLHLGLL